MKNDTTFIECVLVILVLGFILAQAFSFFFYKHALTLYDLKCWIDFSLVGCV